MEGHNLEMKLKAKRVEFGFTQKDIAKTWYSNTNLLHKMVREVPNLDE